MTRSRLRSVPNPVLPVLILLLLALTAPAYADTIDMRGPSRPAKPMIVDTTATIAVEQLAPGVYAAKLSYVWTGWVELGDGILVIDTGFNEQGAKALADTIRARSGNLPIRYVVNTHAHQDHIGGDRFFATLGPTFLAHPNAAEQIQHFLTWGSEEEEEGDALTHSDITPPTVKKISKRTSYGGTKRPVQVLSLGRPAHTNGDLVVYLPKQGILFAGDIVSNRSVPWMVDPGMDVNGWLKSLDSLLTPAFKIETLVPGHGVISRPGQTAIAFTNHYLVDSRDKAAKSAAWGQPLQQVKEWGYLGAYDGLEFYSEVHFLNMRRLYNQAKGIKTPGRKNAHAIKRT
jgi:cyclase